MQAHRAKEGGRGMDSVIFDRKFWKRSRRAKKRKKKKEVAQLNLNGEIAFYDDYRSI